MNTNPIFKTFLLDFQKIIYNFKNLILQFFVCVTKNSLKIYNTEPSLIFNWTWTLELHQRIPRS